MRGSTYSAVLFAFCGVLASLPLLVVAMLPALAWQSAPEFVRVLSVLLIWVTLVGALGLVHPVRRALIVFCPPTAAGVAAESSARTPYS